MHLIDESVGFMGSTAIVGNTIPVGVGLGLSIQLSGSDAVSCVFLGDGAAETGVFFESMNFAAVREIPVLFVCENNLYSVYSPLHVRQPKGRKIFRLAQAIGVEAEHGDGNDVEAVYAMMKRAVADIRRNGGPRFLEFDTYRWREHCGPNFDNDIGYRTEQEYLAHRMQEPIKRQHDKLIQSKLLAPEELAAFGESLRVEIEDAFCYAIESPFPDDTDVRARLYA